MFFRSSQPHSSPHSSLTPVKQKPKLDFSLTGLVFISMMMFMGLAAINSQANLLFGVFGLMIGVLLVSGTISRLVLKRLSVHRVLPETAVVGRVATLAYEFNNGKKYWPSLSVSLGELDGTEAFTTQPFCYMLHAAPGMTATVPIEIMPKRRGLHSMDHYQLSTSFPFGFIKRAIIATQTALLEAMSEEQVSMENQTFPLQRPFMVVATQNPFEFEGTYYLPENQLDRFLLRISIGYPDRTSEHRILTTQPGRIPLDHLTPVIHADDVIALQDAVPKIRIDASLVEYILDIVEATRHHEQLHLGVSPRGALALTQACQASALLAGRDYVTPDDVKSLTIPVCAHRVVSKTYLHNGDANATSRVLQEILDQLPTPS